jgi:hypothetical protein
LKWLSFDLNLALGAGRKSKHRQAAVLFPELTDATANTLASLGEAALIALGVGGRNNEQHSRERESNPKAAEASSHGTPLFSNTDGTVIIAYAEQISRVQHILVSLEIDERGFIFLISRFCARRGLSEK